MAKIHYFNIPAHGHVNPGMPVVQELIRRGHQVTVYCTEELRAAVEQSGATFAAYPGSISAAQIAAATKRLARLGPVLIGYCHELVPFALEEIRREQPDLVMADSMATWARIASRVTGTPTVISYTMLVLGGTGLKFGRRNTVRLTLDALPTLRPMKRHKAELAAAYGADAVAEPLVPARGDRTISFVAPQFQPETPRIDETFVLLGPSVAQDARGVEAWEPPAGDGPLVYISLGTVNYKTLPFYREVFKAFGDYPARFMLTTGSGNDLSELEPYPANFLVRTRLPQLQILEKADVFVTHGGMNSVQEGLYYEVPVIVVPQQIEQSINGRRIAELGAGIVLGDAPPYGRVSVDQLRDALDRVLADPAYRSRAAELGAGARAAGGYLRGADEVEGVLARATAPRD